MLKRITLVSLSRSTVSATTSSALSFLTKRSTSSMFSTVRPLTLVLRSHGYGVLESSDGAEAIHVCLEHQGPIHLLLMDFELGGSNAGPQLAERLLELSPEMQVLFMFSSPPNKLLEVGILPWGCVFLRKPFGADQLVGCVTSLLRSTTERQSRRRSAPIAPNNRAR